MAKRITVAQAVAALRAEVVRLKDQSEKVYYQAGILNNKAFDLEQRAASIGKALSDMEGFLGGPARPRLGAKGER